MRFASWIEGRSGMTTVVRILEGSGAKIYRDRLEAENDLRRDIQASGLTAFPLVVTVPEFQDGVQSLLQAYGIGPLKANTILMNWLHPDSPFSACTPGSRTGRSPPSPLGPTPPSVWAWRAGRS